MLTWNSQQLVHNHWSVIVLTLIIILYGSIKDKRIGKLSSGITNVFYFYAITLWQYGTFGLEYPDIPDYNIINMKRL